MWKMKYHSCLKKFGYELKEIEKAKCFIALIMPSFFLKVTILGCTGVENQTKKLNANVNER